MQSVPKQHWILSQYFY